MPSCSQYSNDRFWPGSTGTYTLPLILDFDSSNQLQTCKSVCPSLLAGANGALDGFGLGAAVEMPRGIRINAVSPEVQKVSREKYDGFFRGHVHVPNEDVGFAYSKAVEGCLTGQVFIVG
jgi:hypothetical protein